MLSSARVLRALLALSVAMSACSNSDGGSTADPTSTTEITVAAPEAVAVSRPATASSASAPMSTVVMPAGTAPVTTAPVTTLPPTTAVVATAGAITTPTVPPDPTPSGSTPYRMPIVDGADVGYAREHHDYPASDVFAGGCGTAVVAPVNGSVLDVRRENRWVESVDNPATRGGRSLSILGDDGVRYYFAHFEVIDAAIEPGHRVAIGDPLGQIGRTGRAGACHVHVGISPPCPGQEWSVRRGVVWPWPYLDAWRRGEQLSPAAEVQQWSIDHPNACAAAMADPFAPDS